MFGYDILFAFLSSKTGGNSQMLLRIVGSALVDELFSFLTLVKTYTGFFLEVCKGIK